MHQIQVTKQVTELTYTHTERLGNMTKYIYIENDKINGCGQVEQLDQTTQNIEVDDTIYNEFLEDNLKYIFDSGKIIKNPNYQKEKTTKELKNKIEKLKLQLEELDKKRIRAVCENTIKEEETNQTWLDFYNKEAAEIRQKITSYTEQLN